MYKNKMYEGSIAFTKYQAAILWSYLIRGGSHREPILLTIAVAIYALSISDPPHPIDVGKVLLKTMGFRNRRCVNRRDAGGGCRLT